jgi:leucyl-tRNA synthetase
MKFKLGDVSLPCATFRPETIYGVTNLWVNPDGEYVEAQVNSERWIISQHASEKLRNQLKQVNVLRSLKGSELAGKQCEDPILGRKLLILPGEFVNTKNATGLVYSVPAHAPYDWLALRDLQRDAAAQAKFSIPAQDVLSIQPISVISVEGYGDFPAIEIVDRMHIRDQNDSLAEEATREIYKAEFHNGILRDNCGPYANVKIANVKQSLVADFRKKGIADVMYELPQKVVCRCNTECVAKVLEGQWFLKYSDPKWKSMAHEAISRMTFYPEEARSWFDGVIDWLQDWPCARKTGLGTPLPWSPDWIVETLSDSTIYMAYYMVSKFVNAARVKPEQLEPEVFDYIYYGEGEPQLISMKYGIEKPILDQMRQEFLYWYPVDLRNSGKDLVGNHLSFFILHHVALFESKYWPLAIGVNGWMSAEGRPMHKSQGNFVPLWKACTDFGADTVRCTVLLAAEGMDDPDWRMDNARDVQNRLESFLHLIEDKSKYTERAENGHLEKWLTSKMQSRARTVSESLQKLKTRTALSSAIYDVWNDLRWYERRAAKADGTTIRNALSVWTRLIAPFAPHLAEESWRIMRQDGYVSNASWPDFERVEIEFKSDELEGIVRQILEDTQEIISTTKIVPKTVHYYSAAKWKWQVVIEAMRRADTHPETLGGLVRDMTSAKVASRKDLPKFTAKIVKQVRMMPTDLRKRRISVGELDEKSVLAESKFFLSRELKVPVEVHGEDDADLYDPKMRSKLAQPYRPAIFIE